MKTKLIALENFKKLDTAKRIPGNKEVVNHTDFNRSNNTVGNLEWCTYSENSLHSKNHNRFFRPKGELAPRGVLTRKQVLKIRQMLSKGISQRKIAKSFSVSQTAICQINRGLAWGWLLNGKEQI